MGSITILNPQDQLKSLPITEGLRALFLAKPSENKFKSAARLVLVESPFVYHDIGYDFSYIGEQDGGHLYDISPVDNFNPGSNYKLIIPDGIYNDFLDISKTSSVGSSSMTGELSAASEVVGGVYSFTVSKSSDLSGGEHYVEFTISDGSSSEVKSIDVKSEYFFKGIRIRFSSGVPFIEGESFQLTLANPTIFDPLILDFSTFSSSNAPDETDTSSRIEVSSLEDFYSQYSWKGDTEVSESKGEVSYYYPNIVEISFDREIDASTVTAENLDISRTCAFNNFMLERIGLFDPSAKVKVMVEVDGSVIRFTLLEGDISQVKDVEIEIV